METMNKPLTYLACPYSHADSSVRTARFHAVNEAAGKLMGMGHIVFSPISHSHPIALAADLPVDWAYWEKFCRAYMDHCSLMIVLKLDGWEDSKGIKAEIAIARELLIPVEFIDGVE